MCFDQLMFLVQTWSNTNLTYRIISNSMVDITLNTYIRFYIQIYIYTYMYIYLHIYICSWISYISVYVLIAFCLKLLETITYYVVTWYIEMFNYLKQLWNLLQVSFVQQHFHKDFDIKYLIANVYVICTFWYPVCACLDWQSMTRSISILVTLQSSAPVM